MKSSKKLFTKQHVVFINKLGQLVFLKSLKFKKQKESFIIKKGS
jgi:hypothetical protein